MREIGIPSTVFSCASMAPVTTPISFLPPQLGLSEVKPRIALNLARRLFCECSAELALFAQRCLYEVEPVLHLYDMALELLPNFTVCWRLIVGSKMAVNLCHETEECLSLHRCGSPS